MDLDERDNDLIDRYVNGKLSGTVLQDFKDRLSTDQDFAKHVNWHEKLVGGIKKQSHNELKTYLQSLDVQTGSSTNIFEKKARFLPLWTYATAACITLLVAAVFVFDLLKPSPGALFTQYYQPYPNVEAAIERSEGATDSYRQAFQWYEDGQYEEAANAFEQLIKADNSSEALIFYAGLTALELNQLEKAVRHFESIIRQPDHKYFQQSLWYAALTCLKNGDVDRSKKYLQQLSGKKGFYGKRAAELLGEL